MRKIYLILLLGVAPTLFFSCHKDSHKVDPVLITTPASNITMSTAVSGGSFTTDGTLPIVSTGIEYDTGSSFPNHWTATGGSGIGTFSADLSGLWPNTRYYIRAFATGIDSSPYYGNILQFTTIYVPSKYKVITVAGTGAAGSTNGDTSMASFNQPDAVAVDASGNMYVADSKNNAIRKITPGGTVTTFATLNATPFDLVLDNSGNVYVTASNFEILMITPGGQVSTFAGTGVSGHADGTGTAAAFYQPITIDIDPAGNLYVADLSSFRKISPGGVVSTLPAFSAVGSCYGVAVDKNFNLYESSSYTVIKVDSSGTESVLAGNGQPGSADGTGTAASFGSIEEIRVDAAGNVYAADFSNYKVRLISPSGVVTTFAGTGAAGSMDGNAAIATFNGVSGLGVDNGGNIYVADENNNKIRKILPL